MYVTEDGKVQHVVFFGSTSILQGVPLLNNPQYPGIAEDLTASYKKWKSLPCDVFLAPHAGFFNLEAQAKRLGQGEKPNPFIDSTAFKTFLEHAERTFLVQLDSDRKSASASNALGNGYGYPNGA
jgi:metallo-beta-lactamase class B